MLCRLEFGLVRGDHRIFVRVRIERAPVSVLLLHRFAFRIQRAVLDAVREVDEEAHDHPEHQSEPGELVEIRHHYAIEQNRERRHERYPRNLHARTARISFDLFNERCSIIIEFNVYKTKNKILEFKDL